MSDPDVIITDPSVDGAASAALLARRRGREYSVHFFSSEELPGFFRRRYQENMPRYYNIFICGLRVVRKDWQARPVRPNLMEALRGLDKPATWFSTARWDSDDRAAVSHLIGEENLLVSPDSPSTAALVDGWMQDEGDELASQLVAMAGDGNAEALEDWRRVLSAHRDRPAALTAAVATLVDGQVDELTEGMLQQAERVEKENDRIGREERHDVRRMGEASVAIVELPPGKTPFWHEIGAAAMDAADAGVCVVHPDASEVLLFLKDPARRLDLQMWLRYLTDCLPSSQTLDGGPNWMPIHVDGLADDPIMERQVLDILRGGAHLLTGS